MKISDFKIKLLFFKPELANYVKIAQRIGIFVCTALLSLSVWWGLPLAFLLFVEIDLRDELDED